MTTAPELARLLEAAAGGDEEAFAELYDATSSFVFGLLMKMLGDEKEATEVAQDVYAQIWREAGDYDPDRGAVRSWIAMIARSRAVDRLRSSRSYTDAMDALESSPSAEHPVGGNPSDPEEDAVHAERRRLVRSAMAELPQEQRRAIEVAFFRGMSHREIAESTDTPLGTVKSRIRAGLGKLEQRLGPILDRQERADG